jgi:hypothetical protein
VTDVASNQMKRHHDRPQSIWKVMVLFCGLLQKVPVLRRGKMIEEADWVMYNVKK